MESGQPTMQRRRSERVSRSLPVVVRGIDLLGQPFEEKTSTLSLNLHGCRYSSRHHLPKNTWVTLEVPQNAGGVHVRARVAWIQRPHSTRDYFQVAVELESPANIWEMDLLNVMETGEVASSIQSHSLEHSSTNEENDLPNRGEIAQQQGPFMSAEPIEKAVEETATTFEVASEPLTGGMSSVADNPLLRDLSAELRRHAKAAVDSEAAATAERIRSSIEEMECKRQEAERNFECWKEQFEKAQVDTRTELMAALDCTRSDLHAALRSASESDFEKIRELTESLAQRSEELRAQHDAAMAGINRLTEVHLQAEAEESARVTERAKSVPQAQSDVTEIAVAAWKDRLAEEMSLAKTQWNELLQSSLDSNVQHIAAELTAQSQDTLRVAEEKVAMLVAELRAPLALISADAREAVASVRAVLDEEVSRARASLSDLEQSAGRMREYAAQLEAANHDTLNELHRRLETMLDSQTDELKRRAEKLATGLPAQLMAPLESMAQQITARSVAEVDSKLAPYLKRAPELLHDLSAQQMQLEEWLRLHRERLRQLSENNQREVSAQMSAALAGLTTEMEIRRQRALVMWGEDLDAGGVRASQSASEAIGRASEWFQQEARARLQVLVEQTVVTAGGALDEKTSEAVQKFVLDLDAKAEERVTGFQEELSAAAGDAALHANTRFVEAADAAASSLGHVLRGIADQESERFAATSRDWLDVRGREFEGIVQRVSRDADSAAEVSLERFRAQLDAQLADSLSEGRTALASEFHAVLEGYRTKRDAHQKDWAESLDRLTGEAAERYQERLETTRDAWMAASARRLDEHGQDIIDSLKRSTDQALRESCTRMFENLTDLLRGRLAASSGVAGFAAQASHDPSDAPHASQ